MEGNSKKRRLGGGWPASPRCSSSPRSPRPKSDRDEYKAAVEPICKTNSKTSDKLLKPVKKLVKKDKLKQAVRAFAKAAKALEKAQKQLAAVEQPPADSAKLNKWLAEIKKEVALMKTISKNFKKGNKREIEGDVACGEASEQREEGQQQRDPLPASATARSIPSKYT